MSKFKAFYLNDSEDVMPVDIDNSLIHFYNAICIDVGDEYHKLSELYEHRHTLFCALTKLYDNYLTPIGTRVKCFKSRNHHSNNDPMFGDSFIVWMEVNKLIGPMDIISYHLPIKWWDKFKLMEMKFAPFYDGYSSEDVLKSIMML